MLSDEGADAGLPLELVMTRAPVRLPTPVGEKVTAAEQVAPGDSFWPQELLLRVKPAALPAALMASDSPFNVASVPGLERVMGMGVLLMWMPVMGKGMRAAGEVTTPAGSAPLPFRAVEAGAEPAAAA